MANYFAFERSQIHRCFLCLQFASKQIAFVKKRVVVGILLFLRALASQASLIRSTFAYE